MKAAVVRVFDQVPRYETFALPDHGDGVMVDVLAAALSPRVRSGASGRHYTSNGILPLVPGLDGVGRLPDGRRVYFIAADDTHGTLAEQARADDRLAVPLPDAVSASLVAAAMLPALSSWVALTLRARLQPGQRVLVLGATGAAGQLAVQIAKHLGAGNVVAAGRDPDALDRVDLVLDYLWGTVTSAILPALCRRREDESRALTWVVIGSVAGDELALSSVLLRKRNLHLLGSGQGASSPAELFSVTPDIVAALAAGALQLEVREAPLAEVEARWSAPLRSGERLVFVPRPA